MSKPTEVMSQHDGKDKDLNDLDILEGQIAIPGDEEFGGTEARKRLEKKLLRKLDARMSILIIIYILNYVSIAFPSPPRHMCLLFVACRSTETMRRPLDCVVSRETSTSRARNSIPYLVSYTLDIFSCKFLRTLHSN